MCMVEDLLELRRVEAVRSACTHEVFAALVAAFAEDVADQASHLCCCAARDDVRGVRKAARRLSDIASSFGAARLADCAEVLAQDCETASPTELVDQCSRVTNVSRDTCSAASAMLKEYLVQ